uniref:starch synthase n=1 Tax=Rhizophora mucronata TaxID=61149 RepID=A0A2P2LH54_RHIMU
MVYSNAVVTVSPTYLKETLCSGWLASTLIRHRDKYFGILNGIDAAMWNPATDVFLPAKFNGNPSLVAIEVISSTFNFLQKYFCQSSNKMVRRGGERAT